MRRMLYMTYGSSGYLCFNYGVKKALGVNPSAGAERCGLIFLGGKIFKNTLAIVPGCSHRSCSKAFENDSLDFSSFYAQPPSGAKGKKRARSRLTKLTNY